MPRYSDKKAMNFGRKRRANYVLCLGSESISGPMEVMQEMMNIWERKHDPENSDHEELDVADQTEENILMTRIAHKTLSLKPNKWPAFLKKCCPFHWRSSVMYMISLAKKCEGESFRTICDADFSGKEELLEQLFKHGICNIAEYKPEAFDWWIRQVDEDQIKSAIHYYGHTPGLELDLDRVLGTKSGWDVIMVEKIPLPNLAKLLLPHRGNLKSLFKEAMGPWADEFAVHTLRLGLEMPEYADMAAEVLRDFKRRDVGYTMIDDFTDLEKKFKAKQASNYNPLL